MSQAPDVAPGRVPADAYERNFADLHPRLSPREARVAADTAYRSAANLAVLAKRGLVPHLQRPKG